MTLDKILKGFNKTIKQLDAFIEKQEVTIDENKKMVATLELDNIDKTDARDKAENIKKKLESLVS